MCAEDIARQEREQKEAKGTVRLEIYEGRLLKENVWRLEYYPNRTEEDKEEIGEKFYDNKIKDFYIPVLGEGGDPLEEQTIYWKMMFADIFSEHNIHLNEPMISFETKDSKDFFFFMYYRGGERALAAKKFMAYVHYYYEYKMTNADQDLQEYFFGKEEEDDDREREE